jgi:hypothetical protein
MFELTVSDKPFPFRVRFCYEPKDVRLSIRPVIPITRFAQRREHKVGRRRARPRTIIKNRLNKTETSFNRISLPPTM